MSEFLANKIYYLKNLWWRFFTRYTSAREFVARENFRSESENGLYVAFVQRAAEDFKIFKNFKRHPSYRAILEHASKEDGCQYIQIIQAQSPEYLTKIDQFKENDLIGSPITYSYEDIGKISPTTLRYVKVASDLQKYFGHDLGANIAEIGVGYGGQMLIMDKLFQLNKYHMFDLPPVLNLVSRYLECHLLRGAYRTLTLNQSTGDDSYDLVISNYAFSELPIPLQRIYITKVLSKSKKGYLTMNSGMKNSVFLNNHLSITELTEVIPGLKVIPEIPLSAEGNYILVWGMN